MRAATRKTHAEQHKLVDFWGHFAITVEWPQLLGISMKQSSKDSFTTGVPYPIASGTTDSELSLFAEQTEADSVIARLNWTNLLFYLDHMSSLRLSPPVDDSNPAD